MNRLPSGCLVAIMAVLGSLAILALVAGVAALAGHGHHDRVHCERASGQCVAHTVADQTFAIADIDDVTTNTKSAKIGTYERETQTKVVLRLKNGVVHPLSMGSGDATSIAEYERAAAELHAFLVGDAPTVDVQYDERLGAGVLAQIFGLGTFGVLLFVIAPVLLLRARRRERAHATAATPT